MTKTEPGRSSSARDLVERVISDRPIKKPSHPVWESIEERITDSRIQSMSIFSLWLLRVGSLLIGFVLVVVLWFTVQPGVVLHWSVIGAQPATFRIYRGLAGSQDYSLIREVPAQERKTEYEFIDTLLIPGRLYTYRIEGLPTRGNPTFSETVNGLNPGAMLAQVMILMTSTILAYSIYHLLIFINYQSSFPLLDS